MNLMFVRRTEQGLLINVGSILLENYIYNLSIYVYISVCVYNINVEGKRVVMVNVIAIVGQLWINSSYLGVDVLFIFQTSKHT